MSRVDRAVRRVRQHMEADEVLLGSAWGMEPDGRRARVVVVTDRRVVVGWRRPSQPEVLTTSTTATYERPGGHLTLVDGDTVVRLQGVDPREGRQVVELLDRRSDRPLVERLGDPFHVRIVER